MSKKKQKIEEVQCGVIWICRTCGAYNLDPIDLNDFECIVCGDKIYAEANVALAKRPKP